MNEINEFSISDKPDTEETPKVDYGDYYGNDDVIIQESQSNCTGILSFVEWIPYSKFEDIKYIDKGDFGKIYSAIWKEGYIENWNIQKQWKRRSQNIKTEFLNETYSFAMIMFEILAGIPPFYNIPYDRDLVLKICNGYRPEIPSNIVISQLLIDIMKRCWNANQQIEECNRLNLTNPVDYNNTNSSTSYEIHPSAIYTSRCFNFKNLPKPKNLNENDDKNTNELTTKDYQNITAGDCHL
ncbi:hypothetical protein Glove_327g42 [Diversispora epigaea]|uniref:Uncharacterized protein n=1 Tax=Diversispora epigaea TaxID=1348612 RepID=A0A397HL90_9GLOM|nr:hypothetical protein Glove_327g42 [Diversispora epigaea]